jgi:hypothetical protein
VKKWKVLGLTAAVALAIGFAVWRNRKWAHEFDNQELPV